MANEVHFTRHIGFVFFDIARSTKKWAIVQKVLIKIAIHIDNSMSVAI